MSAPVPDVLSMVLRERSLFMDTNLLALQQGLLEMAAGQTDGPALTRLRHRHEDLADELGVEL